MYLKGYVEESGTGAEDMIEKYAALGIPAPEWYLDDADDFRVVLQRHVSEHITGAIGLNRQFVGLHDGLDVGLELWVINEV